MRRKPTPLETGCRKCGQHTVSLTFGINQRKQWSTYYVCLCGWRFPRKRAGERPRPSREDVEYMVALYEAGYSLPEVGQRVNMSGNGVRYWLLKEGVQMRPTGGSKAGVRIDERKVMVLRYLYYDKDMSLAECAEIMKTPQTTLHHWMKAYGLPRRPRSEANRVRARTMKRRSSQQAA